SISNRSPVWLREHSAPRPCAANDSGDLPGLWIDHAYIPRLGIRYEELAGTVGGYRGRPEELHRGCVPALRPKTLLLRSGGLIEDMDFAVIKARDVHFAGSRRNTVGILDRATPDHLCGPLIDVDVPCRRSMAVEF